MAERDDYSIEHPGEHRLLWLPADAIAGVVIFFALLALAINAFPV